MRIHLHVETIKLCFVFDMFKKCNSFRFVCLFDLIFFCFVALKDSCLVVFSVKEKIIIKKLIKKETSF